MFNQCIDERSCSCNDDGAVDIEYHVEDRLKRAIPQRRPQPPVPVVTYYDNNSILLQDKLQRRYVDSPPPVLTPARAAEEYYDPAPPIPLPPSLPPPCIQRSASQRQHHIQHPGVPIQVERSGWLHKMGGSTITKRKWTKRWFVLNQKGCCLAYYKSDEDARQGHPKGIIPLAGVKVESANKLNKSIEVLSGGTRRNQGQQTWCFKITPAPPNQTQKCIVYARTRHEQRDWMDAILFAALYSGSERSTMHAALPMQSVYMEDAGDRSVYYHNSLIGCTHHPSPFTFNSHFMLFLDADAVTVTDISDSAIGSDHKVPTHQPVSPPLGTSSF
jgi:hypothetical protein